CQTGDFSFMATEPIHFALIDDVPNSDCLVLPSRCQKLCAWNRGQASYFIRVFGQFTDFLPGGGVPEINGLAIGGGEPLTVGQEQPRPHVVLMRQPMNFFAGYCVPHAQRFIIASGCKEFAVSGKTDAVNEVPVTKR